MDERQDAKKKGSARRRGEQIHEDNTLTVVYKAPPLGGVQREFRGSFAPPSPRVRGCDLNPLGAPEGGAC